MTSSLALPGRGLAALAAVWIAALPSVAAQSGLAEVRLTFEPVAEGLELPTAIAHAGDGSGNLYVTEQAGRIRVIEPGGGLRAEPLLDITDQVDRRHYEQGLLGLAFHPRFRDNGRFYVDYTRTGDGATIVAEYTVVDGAVDRDSERIVLTIPRPDVVHNGGMLAFDAEGRLLVSSGDGGFPEYAARNSQNPDSLLGKILRIEVDGDGGEPQIVAQGLRNPWRFSIDPDGGHIYIGDVGNMAWEEINVVPGGSPVLDFGWSSLEGPQCAPLPEACDPGAFTPPTVAYPRDWGSTVVGGYVYRGSGSPALQGVYLFGDYLLATIWGVPREELLSGAADHVPLGSLGLGEGVTTFGEDESGELHVGTVAGRVLRIGTEDPAQAS